MIRFRATMRYGVLAARRDEVTANTVYLITVWVLPVLVAVTFHEAAHGYVAHLLGDETAWRAGRVSFNPLKHTYQTFIFPVTDFRLTSSMLAASEMGRLLMPELGDDTEEIKKAAAALMGWFQSQDINKADSVSVCLCLVSQAIATASEDDRVRLERMLKRYKRALADWSRDNWLFLKGYNARDRA